jgi:hypothetical protein
MGFGMVSLVGLSSTWHIFSYLSRTVNNRLSPVNPYHNLACRYHLSKSYKSMKAVGRHTFRYMHTRAH